MPVDARLIVQSSRENTVVCLKDEDVGDYVKSLLDIYKIDKALPNVAPNPNYCIFVVNHPDIVNYRLKDAKLESHYIVGRLINGFHKNKKSDGAWKKIMQDFHIVTIASGIFWNALNKKFLNPDHVALVIFSNVEDFLLADKIIIGSKNHMNLYKAIVEKFDATPQNRPRIIGICTDHKKQQTLSTAQWREIEQKMGGAVFQNNFIRLEVPRGQIQSQNQANHHQQIRAEPSELQFAPAPSAMLQNTHSSRNAQLQNGPGMRMNMDWNGMKQEQNGNSEPRHTGKPILQPDIVVVKDSSRHFGGALQNRIAQNEIAAAHQVQMVPNQLHRSNVPSSSHVQMQNFRAIKNEPVAAPSPGSVLQQNTHHTQIPAVPEYRENRTFSNRPTSISNHGAVKNEPIMDGNNEEPQAKRTKRNH